MKRLSIGVACYPGLGGSGIVATELGLRLAARGHRVHFFSAERPRRLRETEAVRFHRVAADERSFPPVSYGLALASTLVAVARTHGLDLVHSHYAVPHATSAALARDVLGGRLGLVTTLHGTDVTHVDPLHRPVIAHAVAASDTITVPSAFLREEARLRLGIDRPIEVIPNFVDADAFRPRTSPDRPLLTRLFGATPAPVLVHVSNFRPVKRVHAVVDVFARVLADRDALLLLIGDGPDRPAVEAELGRRGLADRARLVGELDHAEPLVRECAAFLLPSESESFGLAALEALASGVPVVASAVGGLPEVVRDGETGFLVPPGDAAAMAERVGRLLDHPDDRARMAAAARLDAVDRFAAEPLVDRYEAVYAPLAQ